MEKGIKSTGRRPTPEQADNIRQLFKGFSDSAEWSFDPQDQVIMSGAGMQFQLESSGALPLPVFASGTSQQRLFVTALLSDPE